MKEKSEDGMECLFIKLNKEELQIEAKRKTMVVVLCFILGLGGLSVADSIIEAYKYSITTGVALMFALAIDYFLIFVFIILFQSKYMRKDKYKNKFKKKQLNNQGGNK